jgi:hypothetical protein
MQSVQSQDNHVIHQIANPTVKVTSNGQPPHVHTSLGKLQELPQHVNNSAYSQCGHYTIACVLRFFPLSLCELKLQLGISNKLYGFTNGRGLSACTVKVPP